MRHYLSRCPPSVENHVPCKSAHKQVLVRGRCHARLSVSDLRLQLRGQSDSADILPLFLSCFPLTFVDIGFVFCQDGVVGR